MKSFIASTLFIVFTVLFNRSVSDDIHCPYLGNHHVIGINCFDSASGTTECCAPDNHCENGKCISFRATPPTNPWPASHSVLIGISASLVALIGVMFGAFYWHRRQMRGASKQPSLSASFSQSTRTSTRTSSSAGFRGRSCTAQSKLDGTSVSIERPTTVTV